MTLDSLLAEIAATPDADAPRRVFADRLLEAGDPWGELIHVQLDLAAGGLEPDQRSARMLRQTDLRGALLQFVEPAFPDGVSRMEWHRGWIDRIRVTTACFTSHAARIFETAPLLRTIELSDLEPSITYEPGDLFDELLDRLAAALAVPEARRLEGLIVPIVVQHIEVDHANRDWDGTPISSSKQYDLSGHALARILAADLPRLHMLELRRLANAEIQLLASSPLGARLDYLRLELFTKGLLTSYLADSNTRPLRGLACDELLDHPKLAGLEELQVFDFDEAVLCKLERLRHFVGKPVAKLRSTIDADTWFAAAEDGRPSWAFHPTGEHKQAKR